MLSPAAPGGGSEPPWLAAYLPPLLAERLAAGAGAAAPGPADLEAAVLFSDITGFTGLVERLDTRDPAGVEELSQLLNTFFARLVGIIEQAGGLVEKFAGDSLLAVWPLRGCPPREALHSALACALQIQQQIGPAATKAGERLSLKVGVGVGRLLHLVAGGADSRLLSVLAGEAVETARLAAAHCPGGAVAVTAATAPALAGFAEISARQGSVVTVRSVRPVARAAADDLVAPRWTAAGTAAAQLPPALRQYLATEDAAWMAEFRRVSVLFINIPTLPLPDAAGAACVQEAVSALQAEIDRCEGVVDDVAEDHDGLTLVGAFGLPRYTHADNAVRAVRTALSIAAALRARGLDFAIGIGTGRVFCGAIGGPTRRTYSMVGDTMNRSARLMQMARGEILCDEATKIEAARELPFESLGETAIRGKTQVVGLYRPLLPAAVARPRVTSWTVGRERESAALRRALESMHPAAPSRAVVVVGEAGIGKSALAARFIDDAALDGRVVVGGADAIDRTTGFRAWQPILFDLLDLPPGADETLRTERTLSWFLARAARNPPPESVEVIDALALVPLLNLPLGLKLPENSVVREMPGRSRSEAALRLLAELIDGARADRPLVIVLEDCHWLDTASLALVRAILRGVSGVLLVLLTRPLADPVPETWAELLRSSQVSRLDLGPLDPAAIVALVAHRLGARELPTEVGELLIERSEGHPFFAEEIGYSLRDHGWLHVHEGQCHLDLRGRRLRSVDLPPTMRGVVSARLDCLSPGEQLTLKVASVHGREFSLEMLQAIHPVEDARGQIAQSCARFVAVDLAVPVAEHPGRFAFKHAIVKDVAYEQLVFAQRRELHLRLARWLSHADETNYPVLAYHWARADETQEAVHCLDRASDEASRRFAEGEVVEFLTQAFALTRTHRLALDRLMLGRWHRQLGEAYSHLGQIDDSRAQLAAAARVLGWPVPRHPLGWLWTVPGVLLRQTARRLGWWSPRGVADAARERIYEVLTAYGLLGEVAFFTNDMVATLFCLVRGANIAEKLGPSPMLAQLYSTMAIVTGSIAPGLGERYLRLATEMIAEFDSPVSQGYSYFTLGIFLGGIGEHRRAGAFTGTACALLREYDAGRRLEEALLSAIYPLLHQGRYAECEELLAEMKRSADRRGDAQTLGWWRILRSQQLLPTRGPADALAVLGDDFTTGLDALTRAAMHAAAAACWCRLGDAVKAREHAEEALFAIERRRPVAYTMFLYTAHVAEVFFVLFEEAGSMPSPRRLALRDRALRARRALRQFARAFPVAQARADLYRGLWEWHHQRPDAARRHWLRALAGAEKLGLTPDRAAIYRHLARCDGPAAMEKAAALYAETGATAELDLLPRSPLEVGRRRTIE